MAREFNINSLSEDICDIKYQLKSDCIYDIVETANTMILRPIDSQISHYQFSDFNEIDKLLRGEPAKGKVSAVEEAYTFTAKIVEVDNSMKDKVIFKFAVSNIVPTDTDFDILSKAVNDGIINKTIIKELIKPGTSRSEIYKIVTDYIANIIKLDDIWCIHDEKYGLYLDRKIEPTYNSIYKYVLGYCRAYSRNKKYIEETATYIIIDDSYNVIKALTSAEFEDFKQRYNEKRRQYEIQQQKAREEDNHQNKIRREQQYADSLKEDVMKAQWEDITIENFDKYDDSETYNYIVDYLKENYSDREPRSVVLYKYKSFRRSEHNIHSTIGGYVESHTLIGDVLPRLEIRKLLTSSYFLTSTYISELKLPYDPICEYEVTYKTYND